MTEIKTEICNDAQVKKLFNNQTLSFLQNLHSECKDLNLELTDAEIFTGVLSVLVGHLNTLAGPDVLEQYLTQLIDLYKSQNGYLN